MALFIDVEVDPNVASDPEMAAKLTEVKKKGDPTPEGRNDLVLFGSLGSVSRSRLKRFRNNPISPTPISGARGMILRRLRRSTSDSNQIRVGIRNFSHRATSACWSIRKRR